MMAEQIDRPRVKAECRELLGSAQVNPRAFTAFYLALSLVLSLVDSLTGGDTASPVSVFVSVLTGLMTLILGVGFILYCMAVRRGERAEFLTLFDGFSFVGKIILLYLAEFLFSLLWSFLFIVPGIIALYRYRFAIYNLCENPELGVMQAIAMSKRQTMGYKGQVFLLDLSYLGWGILAQLPALFFYGQDLTSQFGGGAPIWLPSLLLQSLIVGVWLLVVSLFYLAVYQCTELGYFETAKRTSGVSSGSGSGDAPDRLDGGFGGEF